MFFYVLVLSLFSFFFLPETDTSTIVANLEKRLNSISTLEADFSQIYLPSHQSRGLEEKGRLFLKKPDQMRWDYFSPERKSFILKGTLLLSYFFEDRQLVRQYLEAMEIKESILGLLASQRKLAEIYSIEVLSTLANSSTVTVRLEPRQKNEISQIYLETERRSWLIQKITFFEATGVRQEFHFSRFKLNHPLPTTTFEIVVPPDWEIIEVPYHDKRDI